MTTGLGQYVGRYWVDNDVADAMPCYLDLVDGVLVLVFHDADGGMSSPTIDVHPDGHVTDDAGGQDYATLLDFADGDPVAWALISGDPRHTPDYGSMGTAEVAL